MDTKYFRSRFGKPEFTRDWDAVVKALGVNVYDITVPCERAVIFGPYAVNPSVFADAYSIVFYMMAPKETFRGWRHRQYIDMLQRFYYDELHDLSGMKIDKAVKYIRGVVDGGLKGTIRRNI